MRNESRLGKTAGNSGLPTDTGPPRQGPSQPLPKTPANRPAPPLEPEVPPPPRKKAKLMRKKKASPFGNLPVSVGLAKTGMKPAGLTDEELDAMDPQFAINLFKSQKAAEPANKEVAKPKAAVGRIQVQREVVETLVHMPAHDDDGFSILHPARFLPPPTCDQKMFWARLPVTRSIQPPHLEVNFNHIAGSCSC